MSRRLGMLMSSMSPRNVPRSKLEKRLQKATVLLPDGSTYIDQAKVHDIDGTTEYVFTHPNSDEPAEDGTLRKVRPYWYEYSTFAKGRWRGKTLYDMFTTEFRDRSRSYYEYAIRVGLITLNHKVVPLDTIIKNGDLISHKVHRHEPPVVAQNPKIVHRDDEMCVVDKPGSIPIHPTGRYRNNSLVHILTHEYGIHPHPVNRIDRLTSGLVLIAIKKERAQILEREMRSRTIRKEYVCRVIGEFPQEEIICSEPIMTISHKVGLNAVHPNGKECKSKFKRLSYNGKTSVVHCFPETGRTHQIRVHLQYLGHPIANDPLYNNEKVFNLNNKGNDVQNGIPFVMQTEEGAKSIPFLMQTEEGAKSIPFLMQTEEGAKSIPFLMQTEEGAKSIPFLMQTEEGAKKVIEKFIQQGMNDDGHTDWMELFNHADQIPQASRLDENRICKDCLVKIPYDPKPSQLYIYLHAWKYRGDGWAYETDLPSWADENFQELL